MHLRRLGLTLLVLCLLSSVPSVAGKRAAGEPDDVKVQHILISYARKSGKPVERSKKEAEALAYALLKRSQDGEEFDALVKEYTDDSHPGIYRMTNFGAKLLANSYTRDDMAARFGDVAFALEVDEVGIADYHPGLSQFGWHIIKRLE